MPRTDDFDPTTLTVTSLSEGDHKHSILELTSLPGAAFCPCGSRTLETAREGWQCPRCRKAAVVTPEGGLTIFVRVRKLGAEEGE